MGRAKTLEKRGSERFKHIKQRKPIDKVNSFTLCSQRNKSTYSGLPKSKPQYVAVYIYVEVGADQHQNTLASHMSVQGGVIDVAWERRKITHELRIAQAPFCCT